MSEISSTAKIVSILVNCLILAQIFVFVNAKLSSNEAMARCRAVTGLSSRDIDHCNIHTDDCAIDCITKQGTVQTVWTVGNECHDLPGYKCMLGRCRSPDEQQEVDASDLYSLEIRIISAHVPDLDYLPTAGGSDAFIVVQAERSAEPAYENGQMICHTYVVQDNNDPHWSDFVCNPLPLRNSTILNFKAYDSDKPVDHDHLGGAKESVGRLLNQGPKKLPLLYGNTPADASYWVQVEVKGKKFSKISNN